MPPALWDWTSSRKGKAHAGIPWLNGADVRKVDGSVQLYEPAEVATIASSKGTADAEYAQTDAVPT